MRHALVAVLMTLTLVIGSLFAVAASTPEPVQAASAATLLDCELVVGQTTRVVCTVAGEVVLSTVVDLPTVTLPPVTVTAPGATVTAPPVTLPPPPRATQTIRVPVEVQIPGPTRTVTVTVPGSDTTGTTTVTLPPKAGKTITETIRPDGKPVPTETVTATATTTETTTRQAEPESGTVDPSGSTDDFLRFDLDLGDDSVSAGEAGVGVLGALLILLAIWAGMTYGFRRGRASSEAEESDFIREVLDNNKTS